MIPRMSLAEYVAAAWRCRGVIMLEIGRREGACSSLLRVSSRWAREKLSCHGRAGAGRRWHIAVAGINVDHLPQSYHHYSGVISEMCVGASRHSENN